MKITVDTNIIFSAILNTKSVIGDILLNSSDKFQFLSCHFLWFEIEKHWNKLKNISKLEEFELRESQRLIYKNVNFIDEAQISKQFRKTAFELVKDIDENDIAFLALNESLGSVFWTGDKVLIKGLKRKGYNRVATTEDLIKLRDKLD
jgi:predicted nucleic acid-binding protein